MALAPLSLPAEDWKGWLEDRARGQIRHAGDAIAALKDATPGDEAILQVWNDAGINDDSEANAPDYRPIMTQSRIGMEWGHGRREDMAG